MYYILGLYFGSRWTLAKKLLGVLFGCLLNYSLLRIILITLNTFTFIYLFDSSDRIASSAYYRIIISTGYIKHGVV